VPQVDIPMILRLPTFTKTRIRDEVTSFLMHLGKIGVFALVDNIALDTINFLMDNNRITTSISHNKGHYIPSLFATLGELIPSFFLGSHP
jgi:hypothetical protein